MHVLEVIERYAIDEQTVARLGGPIKPGLSNLEGV
jgi:hypothetical protein